MSGLRTFWQRGWIAKAILIAVGLGGTLVFCCVALVAIAIIIPSKPQPSATAVAQSLAVVREDATTAASATPQPSATPTNTTMPSPTPKPPTATAEPTATPTEVPT